MVASGRDRVAALVRSDEFEDKARTRAVPLPEEAAVQEAVPEGSVTPRAVREGPGEDRRAEAETILRDSEDRVTEAATADRPADAAQEHRRSEDTVQP